MVKMEKISLEDKSILITGAAGFIGSNLCIRLLKEVEGVKVIGLDNMNDYYDVNIKNYRLEQLSEVGGDWTFIKGDLSDKQTINGIFSQYHPNVVVNLGAQAGVRYSITNPDAYIKSNMIGFYNIPSTGLRFFTVYGPAGRPDMAYFGFTNKLVNRETIKIFNYGNCMRDFTFIDDIVEGVIRVMKGAPEKKTGEDGLPVPPYAVYNIGNNAPENLLDFVTILQEELVRAGVLQEGYNFEAHKELVPMQPGDVPVTYADTTPLEKDYGFKPSTPLRDGLRKFATWYKEFYQ